MKFLLINTPDLDTQGFLGAPTGLYYASTLLTSDSFFQNNADIVFFDPPTVKDFFKELPVIIADDDIAMIGFSCTSHVHWIALQGAKIVREINPNCLIVFGGPHEDEISGKGHDRHHTLTRWNDRVDIVVSGDGEYLVNWLCRSLLKLCKIKDRRQTLKKLGDSANDLKKLPGKGFLDLNDETHFVRLPMSQSSLHLDNLPLLNWSYVDPRHFYDYPIFYDNLGNVKRTAQVMTHRGCRATCYFCTERLKYNIRSNHLIVEEIEGLKVEHGVEAIFFDDSTFNEDIEAANQLCRDLQKCKIEWGCLTRFDKVDRETLEIMKKSGCSYIYFGLEQFDDNELQRLRKNITTAQIVKIINHCKDIGIRVGVSCLFGNGESRDVAKKTIEQVGYWGEEGVIKIVSLSAICYHPGSVMTSLYDNKEQIDYDREPPHSGMPWICFEEGLWYHPKDFTEDYAWWIVDLVSKNINSDFLVRGENIRPISQLTSVA